LAEAAGTVLILQSAADRPVLVAFDDDGSTGENPWETSESHHPQTPAVPSPPLPKSGEIAIEDRDQVEEEDLANDDIDDADEIVSPDEHARARADAEVVLAEQVGRAVIRKCATSGKTASWIVVDPKSLPFPEPPECAAPSYGMVGGLPLLASGEPDLVSLRRALYPAT
jgi:hypothetical protein